MVTKGKIRPIRDHVIVSDMDFGIQKTATGIIIQSDNGKSRGVKPRWGRVWAVGPEQTEVTVGEWICVEHGRWTRTFEVEQDDGSEVIGTIVLDPGDDRFVLFTADIDTLPQNTLLPIDAIIDPLISGPQEGLDSAIDGQRYLLTEATGDGANEFNPVAWLGANGRPLIADANDIIEYQNNFWRVVFRSAGAAGGQYVTNITTGVQYEWTGNSWVKSYQGVYPGGTWRLVL
jgi:co-chaperonin GroES (HSP10)